MSLLQVYSVQYQLRVHIDVVHRNLRPYNCEQCGAKFGRSGGLRRHYLMVHQQKKYMCPYEGCEHPGYKCTKALAAHIRSVHTLERPFSCFFCERTFVRKNDLKVHELTHTTQSDFICGRCNRAFRRMVYLQKHQKRCTGEPRRRRFKRCPSGSSSTICATPSHITTHGVGDESMTRETGEYHSNEQSLPAKFPRVTEDESPKKSNWSMVTGIHLINPFLNNS
ncbi:hypothetical protein KIN20_031387 [Parelaphostrongylus tenuis]|uniref:C2H2-type domain-containing protein n=1 Tax=Parelaphostrongylus tenuis TaxID=148309 RepID=A0AAD5WGZ3_PARTN|nr:hypothetical protein KIN20_031387 [Parelaphostrongylus tenuis]